MDNFTLSKFFIQTEGYRYAGSGDHEAWYTDPACSDSDNDGWDDYKEIFVEGWEWEADNTVEKIQNEFICLVGVLTLYTWTQIGIILYFFPAIQSEMIFGLRLLIVMPIVNSLIIYIGYRLTILKW